MTVAYLPAGSEAIGYETVTENDMDRAAADEVAPKNDAIDV